MSYNAEWYLLVPSLYRREERDEYLKLVRLMSRSAEWYLLGPIALQEDGEDEYLKLVRLMSHSAEWYLLGWSRYPPLHLLIQLSPFLVLFLAAYSVDLPSSHISKRLYLLSFHTYEAFAYAYVCLPLVCLVPMGFRRWHWIPCNWSCGWLWAAMWVRESNLGPLQEQ